MNAELQNYLNNIHTPWGQLFYRLVWGQIPEMENKRILDFGSGFGITANHFAKNNEVYAVEPNADMVQMGERTHPYRQIVGDIRQLEQFPAGYFDLVICHNVLEYAPERKELLREFCRLLPSEGILSVVKHNHPGRIMQKVVFENRLEEALSLIDGEPLHVMNFGQIHYYTLQDMMQWIPENTLRVDSLLGIRTFWGLQQNNEVKYSLDWQEKMLALERKVCDKEAYRSIAFFHHILLGRTGTP